MKKSCNSNTAIKQSCLLIWNIAPKGLINPSIHTYIHKSYSYYCINAMTIFLRVEMFISSRSVLSWYCNKPVIVCALDPYHRDVKWSFSEVTQYLLISVKGKADQRPSFFLLTRLPAQQSKAALEEQIISTAKNTFWAEPDLRAQKCQSPRLSVSPSVCKMRDGGGCTHAANCMSIRINLQTCSC